jgi:hypothetical protein
MSQYAVFGDCCSLIIGPYVVLILSDSGVALRRRVVSPSPPDGSWLAIQAVLLVTSHDHKRQQSTHCLRLLQTTA